MGQHEHWCLNLRVFALHLFGRRPNPIPLFYIKRGWCYHARPRNESWHNRRCCSSRLIYRINNDIPGSEIRQTNWLPQLPQARSREGTQRAGAGGVPNRRDFRCVDVLRRKPCTILQGRQNNPELIPCAKLTSCDALPFLGWCIDDIF